MGSNNISTSQKNSSDTPQLGKVVTVQIVTMLIAVVSMLIDGMMTGIFLGDDCLAAYGLTNPVNMLLVALGGLLAFLPCRTTMRRSTTSSSMGGFRAFPGIRPAMIRPGETAVRGKRHEG